MGLATSVDTIDDRLADPLGTIAIQSSETGPERVLQVRNDLVSAGAFEFAIRERAARLATLRHPVWLPIRRIARQAGQPPRVSVVSDHPTALSLRQVLNSGGQLMPVPLGWAVGVIRDVLEGVAALHAVGLDVAHGIITPDRVFVDGDGHVRIADYVFGTALQQLRYTADRYAREFLVQMPSGNVLFDQRLDLYQIGGVASALLQSAGSGAVPLDDALREWLARITQTGPSFASAREALNALLVIEVPPGPGPSLTHAMTRTPEQVVSTREPVAIDVHSRDQGTELVCHDGPAEPFIDPRAETCHVDIDSTPQETTPSASEPVGTFPYIPSKPAIEMPRVQTKPPRPDVRVMSRAPHPLTRSRSTAIPVTVAVLSAVLVVALIGRARAGSSAASAIRPATHPSAASALALGQVVDSAPPMSIGTATGAAPAAARSLPVKPELARKATEPVPAKVPGPGIGWIELRSPIDAQVVEDGRVITATGWPRAVASEGSHHVTIVNNAIGVREARTIAIAADRISVVTFEPPHGALSVNAVPWAEVSLDGRALGETPLGNISATVGSHEVVFRHPNYGEQRRTVAISAGGAARLSVDFTKATP